MLIKFQPCTLARYTHSQRRRYIPIPEDGDSISMAVPQTGHVGEVGQDQSERVIEGHVLLSRLWEQKHDSPSTRLRAEPPSVNESDWLVYRVRLQGEDVGSCLDGQRRAQHVDELGLARSRRWELGQTLLSERSRRVDCVSCVSRGAGC